MEIPATDWARYVGVKYVQNVKIGHAPRTRAEEQNDRNLEQAVSETFLYRSAAADDRNHKRSELAENSGVSGETTARDDTRGVLNTQKEAVKQVRPRLHGAKDHRTKKPPNHSNQPST